MNFLFALCKRMLFAAVVLSIGQATNVLSQTANAESQKLTSQVSELLRRHKYEEAIALSERIVGIQTKSEGLDVANAIAAWTNLARVKAAFYRHVQQDRTAGQNDRQRRYEVRAKFPKQIEDHYERALSLYRGNPKSGGAARAELQFEFAEFVGEVSSAGFRNGPEYEKAKGLYDDAFEAVKGTYAPTDDKVMAGAFSVANFFQKHSDFERSFPLYMQYVNGIERKYGPDAEFLLPALRALIVIYVLTERDANADELLDRVIRIANRAEKRPEAISDLSRRTTRDVESEMMADPTTITRYTKKLKWLRVKIIVDEKGNVIEAKPDLNEEIDIHGKKVRENAAKQVRSWKFRPLAIDGTKYRMRGQVSFAYLVQA